MSQSEKIAKRILIVDDSPTVGLVVKNAVQTAVNMPVDLARSLAACAQMIADHPSAYQIAVVDLHLPDAANGEAVDMVLGYGVATIVLTGSLDNETHERISAKPIVDYVTKQSPGSIAIVQKSVAHTLRNMKSKVLIVEPDPAYRAYLKNILQIQRLDVIEVDNALEGLSEMELRNDINVILTAYEMPEMDGVNLCMKLRSNFPSTKLAIIGITTSSNDFSGVRFFKAGADDIIHKPFIVEELVSRINARLDYLDSLRIIHEQANRDYLTKLFNRRYLFEIGNPLFSSAQRKSIQIAIAMIDIDHFKRINDSHGHDVGDMAIVAVAQTIAKSFRNTDIVARMGGEEFCVVAVNNVAPVETMNRIRQQIESLAIPLNDKDTIRLTVSIGISTTLCATLDEMINKADEALYKAKQGGRNQVVLL
jgi:diguanylate cyclase (GGDEF)-like protein